jgi:hypothetical protein
VSDWLFDPSLYGESNNHSHTITDEVVVVVEPYQPPWLLLANRRGVNGFHWPESVTEYGTTHALCGAMGHSVVPPETMVRCSECERLRQLP